MANTTENSKQVKTGFAPLDYACNVLIPAILAFRQANDGKEPSWDELAKQAGDIPVALAKYTSQKDRQTREYKPMKLPNGADMPAVRAIFARAEAKFKNEKSKNFNPDAAKRIGDIIAKHDTASGIVGRNSVVQNLADALGSFDLLG